MKMMQIWRSLRSKEHPLGRIVCLVADILSVIALFLIFVCQYRALTEYTAPLASRLLNVQLIALIVLFVLQLRRLKRIGIWAVILANAIAVPIIAHHTPMGEFVTIYIVLMLMLILFRQMVLPRGVFVALHLMNALFLSYFLAMAERMISYDDYYVAFMRAYNVNTVGILGVACMMHWACFFDMLRMKKRYRLLGQLLGMILGFYYVHHSGCRSALLAVILFVLLYLVCYKPIPSRWFQALMVAALAILAGFPLLYIRWSHRIDYIKLFGENIFSGRQMLWEDALYAVLEHPFMGAGLSTQSSMHHVLVELVLRFGIVAVISFFVLLLLRDKRGEECRISRLAQISFLACMAIACFESFFTDRYLCFFFLSFLLTAVKSNKRDASQK